MTADPASDNSRVYRVAVIGGGITGLAAAQRLVSRSKSVQVTLFESSHRLGGIIRTEEADGFLMELGPDSFITNKPAATQLCAEIGYADQLISTDSRFRRSLVLRKGRPVPVPDGFMLMAPTNPWAILTTPVLSLAGRLRLLAEAFVARRTSDEDESLASFVRRRFGQQTLDRLVQPLVGGIYTADPEKLSLKATLPRFLDMERSHGSVIRANLARRKSSGDEGESPESYGTISGGGARYSLFATAARGLSDLVQSLEAWLRKNGRVSVRPGCAVSSISMLAETASAWRIETGTSSPPDQFDAVIMTLPTHLAAQLLKQECLQELRTQLSEIEYASTAIVVSGHQLSDFSHSMDAFGLVIPAIERRKILAVSFSSRKFLNRAPEGRILLRTFVGGAMQPELLQLSSDVIASTVNEELRQIFGMHKDPVFSEVIRYDNAMPQYHVGHLDRVARIEAAQSGFPGLCLAGSAYHGVGIPDSIASGRKAADAILNIGPTGS